MIKRFINTTTILSFIMVSACSSNIVPVVTGGSKADGIVALGYQYGYFQKPHVDMQSAGAKALQRCQAWGYSRAEIFDGVETQCFQQNMLGKCLEGRVKIQYQCVN